MAQTEVSAYNVGDPGSIPESGRSPGEGNGNPLQYSCLGNSIGRGAWPATVHGGRRVGHFSFSLPPSSLLTKSLSFPQGLSGTKGKSSMASVVGEVMRRGRGE